MFRHCLCNDCNEKWKRTIVEKPLNIYLVQNTQRVMTAQLYCFPIGMKSESVWRRWKGNCDPNTNFDNTHIHLYVFNWHMLSFIKIIETRIDSLDGCSTRNRAKQKCYGHSLQNDLVHSQERHDFSLSFSTYEFKYTRCFRKELSESYCMAKMEKPTASRVIEKDNIHEQLE